MAGLARQLARLVAPHRETRRSAGAGAAMGQASPKQKAEWPPRDVDGKFATFAGGCFWVRSMCPFPPRVICAFISYARLGVLTSPRALNWRSSVCTA